MANSTAGFMNNTENLVIWDVKITPVRLARLGNEV